MRRGAPWKAVAAALATTCSLVACSASGSVGARGDRPATVTEADAPDAGPDLRDTREDAAADRSSAAAAAAAAAASSDVGAAGAAAANGSVTPGAAAAASQPVGRGYVDALVENRLPGTPGWRTASSGAGRSVEGFADATSVTAGSRIRLYVSSTGATFRVQVVRLGWYGGVGARQVWLSVPVRGGVQAPPSEDPTTRMITAPWKVSATLPTDGLVAGDYLAKLIASDGASSFVPFTVRERTSPGAVVLVNSTLTWLAYNPWGGASSYTASGAESREEGYDERSVVSSMDRPFARGSGSGGLLGEEYNLVRTAERLGLKLNYAADLDLHANPEVLQDSVGVALLGHSEYWSRQMRAALTAARDAGVNLAFLGANDVYRRIRLLPAATGPFRLMVNYKDGSQDPVKDQNTTADWPNAPFRDPQSSLTGVQYRCAHARADLVVTDPDAWVFRGLGLQAGQRLPGMIGTEFDRVNLGLSTPRPIQIMAHSPVACYGQPEYADLAWYTVPSGAGVFAAGTLNWNAGIEDPDPTTRAVIGAVTERVYTAIARPLAGRAIPAVDNAAAFYTPSGPPLDAATAAAPATPSAALPGTAPATGTGLAPGVAAAGIGVADADAGPAAAEPRRGRPV